MFLSQQASALQLHNIKNEALDEDFPAVISKVAGDIQSHKQIDMQTDKQKNDPISLVSNVKNLSLVESPEVLVMEQEGNEDQDEQIPQPQIGAETIICHSEVPSSSI